MSHIEHDQGWHTLPKDKFEPFLAMYQGQTDNLFEVYNISAKGYGNMMALPGEYGVVYITKQQAMQFFGLVEA